MLQACDCALVGFEGSPQSPSQEHEQLTLFIKPFFVIVLLLRLEGPARQRPGKGEGRDMQRYRRSPRTPMGQGYSPEYEALLSTIEAGNFLCTCQCKRLSYGCHHASGTSCALGDDTGNSSSGGRHPSQRHRGRRSSLKRTFVSLLPILVARPCSAFSPLGGGGVACHKPPPRQLHHQLQLTFRTDRSGGKQPSRWRSCLRVGVSQGADDTNAAESPRKWAVPFMSSRVDEQQQRPSSQRPQQSRERRPPQEQQQQQQQQQSSGSPVQSLPDEAVAVSIESIATALENGQSLTGPQNGQQWRSADPSKGRRSVSSPGRGGREGGKPVEGQSSAIKVAEHYHGDIVGGGGSSKKKANQQSLKKRRARRKNETPEERRLQNDVAQELKAGSATGTLEKFNLAMEAGVALPSNLLCGVLNQCARAGWMDECMRVCTEMKERGMVIEENNYVPLIRGMVAQGDCGGALSLIGDMVDQGVQPRLRCYEPVIAGMCDQGDMDGARQAWAHMEQQGVIPREQLYVDFLCGLGVAGELWDSAAEGTLDTLLTEMSYHARNLTMDQVSALQTHFNAVSIPAAVGEASAHNGEGHAKQKQVVETLSQVAPPLARRVKVTSVDGVDDEDWSRGWTDAVAKKPTSCPACGGQLKAVGLTAEERGRIRDTLFGLAGLQVKKHARNRWTKMARKSKKINASDTGYFSFTDEDQREQLQIFVDWLHAQRAAGKTYTAVIDSANVAYHKGNPWHFSVPQVDLMVQALEAKGERPLVVIAEKYMDRVGDTEGPTLDQNGKFKYMSTTLNKAIVKRWRTKSQIYECSDEASDDWYWMYAAVAFDDIPMTVISNDRTRDHRMSLAEPVPFLRWRTTQLAKFELSWGLMHVMARKDTDSNEGVNSQGWPKRPPSVAIQAPPAFTRDIQRSEQGCWHLPAGAEDDWLCLDIPRGVDMGLNSLQLPRKKHSLDAKASSHAAASSSANAEEALSARGRAASSPSVAGAAEVSGLLQSMRVKKSPNKAFRYSTQGTVEEAAKSAATLAAKVKANVEQANLDGDVDVTRARKRTGRDTSSGDDPQDQGVIAIVGTAGATLAGQPEMASSAGRRKNAPVRTPPETGDELSVISRGRGRSANPESGRGMESLEDASLEEGGSSQRGVGMSAGERQQQRDHLVPQADDVVAPSSTSVQPRLEADVKIGDSVHVNGNGGSGDDLEAVREGDDRDWASLTVVVLKDELRKRGLKVSGRKAELVERLSQA